MENFEVKDIKLKVKIFLGIKVKIKREVIWSDFGPVIKNKKGYFINLLSMEWLAN